MNYCEPEERNWTTLRTKKRAHFARIQIILFPRNVIIDKFFDNYLVIFVHIIGYFSERNSVFRCTYLNWVNVIHPFINWLSWIFSTKRGFTLILLASLAYPSIVASPINPIIIHILKSQRNQIAYSILPALFQFVVWHILRIRWERNKTEAVPIGFVGQCPPVHSLKHIESRSSTFSCSAQMTAFQAQSRKWSS